MNLTIRYSNFKKSVLFFLLTISIIVANSNLAYACDPEEGYSSDTGSVIIKDGAYNDWSNRLYGDYDNDQSDNNELDDNDPASVVEV